ncbi:MAG: peptide chain release factor N(5)-glutamine methyltransferase [Clostridia bacterium]|nr:peptide chain release factor N(5)-glutamine methyltransferase [Clostridia bacterium]
MTAGEWLSRAGALLQASGDLDTACDADWLLCEATGWSRSSLRLRRDEPLADETLSVVEAWLARRAAGEPLQYVLGTADFMGLSFLADSRALIPRSDTETLCEAALKRLREMPPQARVLDLCCGTGAIGLSIARFRPDAQVLLADVSGEALCLARENAARLGVTNARFVQEDLFKAAAGECFDLIACNPPYLDQADMDNLQAEVRREPTLALFGGPDGLDFYRRIARDAPAHLAPGGVMLLEVGQGQAPVVARMLGGWANTALHRDLNGIERVVEARAI